MRFRYRLLRLAEWRGLAAHAALAEMIGSLLRTFVLARVLGPDQFGVAIALALVVVMAEIIGDVGLDRSIVRLVPERDLAEQRNTLHSLALLRGGLLSLGLLAASAPLAASLGTQEALPAFLAVAAAPLVKSLWHLGVKQAAREYRFGLDALATIVSHVSVTVITFAVAIATSSYWSVPLGLLAGLALAVATSHALANEPWRLSWDRATAAEAWQFGAPLIPNGIAQAIKNVGDRLIVGSVLGPAALGLYSLTAMIGVLPRGIVIRYLTTVFMPRFVNTGQGPQARPLVGAFAIACSALAAALGLGLWSVGQPLIAFVFGRQFEPPQSLMAAVSIMTAAKFLFAITSLPAVAWGSTRLILIGSVGSVLGIAIGSVLLSQTGNLTLFVYAVAIADVLALAVALAVGRRPLIIGAAAAGAAAAPIATLALLALASEAISGLGWWPARLGAAMAVALILSGCAAWLLAKVESSPAALWRTLRAKPPPPVRPVDGAPD